MIPEFEGKIAFRLSMKERQQIDQIVMEGKFKNISHVVRFALKEFLSSLMEVEKNASE